MLLALRRYDAKPRGDYANAAGLFVIALRVLRGIVVIIPP